MEKGSGIPVEVVVVRDCSEFHIAVRGNAGRGNFAGESSRKIQRRNADPAYPGGEHELFYELIRPYERRVYSAAFAILRNEADAEDAAQEAVLKAFKHIRQFRAEARFSTWLIQITVNEARMVRRKEHAHLVDPIAE